MGFDLTRPLFAPHIGTTFTFSSPGAGAGLVLTGIEDDPFRREAGRAAEDAFALQFIGPPGQVLPQQIYTVEHPGIGQFDLFIVPVGRDVGGIRYEAVFNRIAS